MKNNKFKFGEPKEVEYPVYIDEEFDDVYDDDYSGSKGWEIYNELAKREEQRMSVLQAWEDWKNKTCFFPH